MNRSVNKQDLDQDMVSTESLTRYKAHDGIDNKKVMGKLRCYPLIVLKVCPLIYMRHNILLFISL